LNKLRHNLFSVDSDDDEPLEKRLAGINLDNADEVWDSLTAEERDQFKKLVEDVNSIQNIVPEWVPWWTFQPDPVKLVEELSPSDGKKKDEEDRTMFKKAHKNQPDILHPIPKMSSLTVMLGVGILEYLIAF
jgi:hypothetical protein